MPKRLPVRTLDPAGGADGQGILIDAGEFVIGDIGGDTPDQPIEVMVAVSDEATAITSGTSKVTFRMPCAMTLTAVRASLTTASASGGPVTVDINEGGSSILSTKLTIDDTEKTSTTAATAAVISDANLADDAEITVDIDDEGSGAKGLKIILIGTRVAPPHPDACEVMVAVSDESTTITTGTAKMTFRMPFAMTLNGVRAALTTASSSGAVTVDINEAGSSILSTKLTVDASETTSTTAATPPVISDTALADDAEITVDIDGAGTGAAGLKVTLIGVRA